MYKAGNLSHFSFTRCDVSHIDITAGQAPDQLHFSKYFLLGSTGTARAELSNGGCCSHGIGRAGQGIR